MRPIVVLVLVAVVTGSACATGVQSRQADSGWSGRPVVFLSERESIGLVEMFGSAGLQVRFDSPPTLTASLPEGWTDERVGTLLDHPAIQGIDVAGETVVLRGFPLATGFYIPMDTAVFVTGTDTVPRRQFQLALADGLLWGELSDLFERFELRIVGAASWAYIVRSSDPGPGLAAFVSHREALAAHPAVRYASAMGGRLVIGAGLGRAF